MKSGVALLVSPLPPPSSGIGTWTETIRTAIEVKDWRADVVDTAVRWRPVWATHGPLRLAGGAAQAIRDILRCAWRVLRSRPDVLHLCSSAGPAALKDIVILGLGRATGVPAVLHLHTSRLKGDRASRKVLFAIEEYALKIADVVIVLDAEIEAMCREVLGANQRVALMANPIPRLESEARSRVAEESGDEDGTLHLVFCGNVVVEKGVDLLVDACAGLSNVNLVVVGPTENRMRLALLASARKRDGGRWLHIAGGMSRNDALRCVREADALALPSRMAFEAFPYAVLEAMALGRPVVATNVGALREMLVPESPDACGVCVAPGDVAALQDAIRMLRDNADWRLTLGANGRRRALSLYSPERIAEELVSLWRRVSRAE